MERQNAELYWQNYRIMLENERLRKKAIELDQENRALMAQIKERMAAGEMPDPPRGSTSTANQMNINRPGKNKV